MATPAWDEKAKPTESPRFSGEDESRNAIVEIMMQEQRHEWTKQRDLTVFCGTWNVNAKVPNENLEAWLCPYGAEKKAPDVYCIGIQEIVELNAMNIGMSDANSAKQSQMWEDKVEREALKGRYTKIMGKHFVGLMMVIYVRNELVLQNAISLKASEKIGVGKMGLGNKGAICIRMNFWETSICFVNTHLTAGKSKCNNRNLDFESIISKVAFKLDGRSLKIKDHDYCFWVGDLNYRLNATDLIDVYKRIRASPPDMSYLLNADQLLTERSSGRVFQGFLEQDITFLPTYKYIPGTLHYDDREDGKRRMPAWCDRVQWYTKAKTVGIGVSPTLYKRAELRCSDHKPVMAMFSTKSLVPKPKREIEHFRQALIRKLFEYENDHIPQVTLSKSTIDLGDVHFDKRAHDSLVITNTGKAMAEYHFVPVPGSMDGVAIKPWIQVHPESCVLLPGASKELHISAHVTKEFAQKFNKGAETIEHILILQLRPGRGARKHQEEGMRKSQFISVNGRYLASCFGCSLDYLCHASEAVRSRRLITLPSSKAFKVPKELWRLVDHLFRRGGLFEYELFITEGDPHQVESIIEALNTGDPFEKKVSLHSVAETLVQFLRNLKHPVFPYAILNQVEGAWGGRAMNGFCKLALRQLKPINYRVFVYVVAFIREILKHSSHNKLTVDLLVPVFSKCLFEHDVTGRAQQIMRHFLSADNFT